MRKFLTFLFATCLTVGAWALPKPLPTLHVEGKWLVDTYGNHVVLHGVMDTPSMWFNSNRWQGGYNAEGAKNCRAYFSKIYAGMEQSNCDVFRLHLDPAWTNNNSVTAAGFTSEQYVQNGETKTRYRDPIGQVVDGEGNIMHFDVSRLKTFLQSLYIPLMLDAINHGMYVVIRPPGVCPGEIRVNGYYHDYLLEVWDIVSKDPTIQQYAGQISIELANEPISVKNSSGASDTKALYNFFQPIVNKIRENGFKGIIWVPGTGYQSNYRDYKTYPITGDNIGYAVHDYPGWYNCSDDNANAQTKINSFLDAVPVVKTNPVIITEVDWSPLKEPKEIKNYNEFGQPVYKNLGTWATATTSKWGKCYKALLDYCGNISMTLTSTDDYMDVTKLLQTGEATPAFGANPEACGKACFDWYAEYAKVDNPVADWVNEAPGSDLGNGKFMNPVVRADFPDPDVIRVGDVYYMVSTTMCLFPGATILKSKDMVNWEYCCQPLTQLANTDNYNLKNGQNAYAGGMWACSMKYYNGKFYILVNGSDTGFWLLTAEDPEGTWQKKQLNHNYYDPGMLFDNGKVYVACGAGKIRVCELDQNFNFIQEKEVIDRSGTQLEGCHFYKKGSYYYIYATYAGWPDQQVVFRSKNIFGPYEEKQVLDQWYDNTPNLIHQGSLLQDVNDKWWTIMQEDLGALGRFPNLQPVTWVNDWPVVGNNGKPYKSFVDAITKPASSLALPQFKPLPTTDNFRDYPLGMQWEWNHNPDNNAWSVFERAGWLRLKTNTVVSKLHQARNMLTQRIFIDKDKASTGTVRIDASRLQEGDRAGICIFQDPYAAIAIEVKNGNRQIVWFQDGVKAPGSNFTAAEKTQAVTLTDNIVYLRAAIKYGENKTSFYYSTDNKNWTRLGSETSQSFNLSVFVGSRFGLFCYSTQTSGGSADFDWFSTESEYDETALYGEVKTTLDPKKFTVTKIEPGAKTIETLIKGACSPGIKATYLDKHTEIVSTQAVYTPEDEGVVEFRNGQMSGLAQGSTRVAVSYTDAFGNQVDTAFTALSSYFPLDKSFIVTNLAGNGKFNRYTDYAKFTFTSKDDQPGWNFDNYFAKGVNLTSFKYLVINLKYSNAAKASINFYISSTSMKGGCSMPLSTDNTKTAEGYYQTVIPLQDLKYTFGANTGRAFKLSTLHKVTFSSANATTNYNRSISIAEIYLTNEDPTTGISDIAWKQQQRQTVNVYNLSGRLVRRAVNRNDALQGLKPGIYLVDGSKMMVK